MANLVTACAVAGCLVFTFGTLVGHWSVRTVLTGSMTPVISRGDVVLAAPVALDEITVGEIIVFNAPIDQRVTVHRVVQIDRENGDLLFQTQGDANDARDPWRMKMHQERVHRVVAVVPGLGGIIRALGAPTVRIALALGSALLVGVVGFRSIWRPDTPIDLRRASSRTTRPPRRRVGRFWSRRRVPWLAGAIAVVLAGAMLIRVDTAEASFVGTTGTPASVTTGTLGTPGATACRWASATTLTFTWSTALTGLETGTQLQRSLTSGGAQTLLATVTPASATTTTQTALAPVTTPRFYRLNSARGSSWTSAQSPEQRSDQCAAAVNAYAGTGTAGATGDGAAATSATLSAPRGLATTAAGITYIADTTNNRIRRVDAAGTITTFAGGPAASPCSYTGPVSGLGLNAPRGVEVDSAGNVYVADTGAACVRMIDTAGNVTRVAGGGATTACASTGLATAVSLSSPSDVAVDSAGAVYIADTTNACIRKVAGGTYTQVAGGGATTGCATTGLATTVSLSGPIGVAVDSAGAVYIADTGRACIRKVASGTYTQVAGGGATTACATAVAGTALSLSGPEDVEVDGAGTVYFTDTGRRCVRRVSGGTSALVAFTGTSGTAGDAGPAIAATIVSPSSLALTSGGDLLVSDRAATAGSNRVRRVVTP